MSTWGQMFILETGISRSFCGIDEDHPNKNKTQRRTSQSIPCWLQQVVCHHDLGLAEAQAQPGVDRKAWVWSDGGSWCGKRGGPELCPCAPVKEQVWFSLCGSELDLGTNVRELVVTDHVLGNSAEAVGRLPGWSLSRL